MGRKVTFVWSSLQRPNPCRTLPCSGCNLLPSTCGENRRRVVRALATREPNLRPGIPDLNVLRSGIAAVLSVALAWALRSDSLLWASPVSVVPQQWITEQRTISGVVVSVSDGDTFRLQNVGPFHPTQDRHHEQSFPVRLAGVDAPEISHFGNPAQPFSEEAKEWMKQELLGKSVAVHILGRDQYGRIVGSVRYTSGLFSHDLATELLRRGFATIYRGRGASYDGDLSNLEATEINAKAQGVGIWSLPDEELPAEYKRRTRARAF